MYHVICPALPGYSVPYSQGDLRTEEYEPSWEGLDFLIYVAM
jgi:hypothetical protein